MLGSFTARLRGRHVSVIPALESSGSLALRECGATCGIYSRPRSLILGQSAHWTLNGLLKRNPVLKPTKGCANCCPPAPILRRWRSNPGTVCGASLQAKPSSTYTRTSSTCCRVRSRSMDSRRLLLRDPPFVEALEVEPKIRRLSRKVSESKGCINRDCTCRSGFS